MAKPISHRRLIAMVEAMEPAVRDAFLRAIGDIRSHAAVGEIARLLEAGRIDEAVSLLGINPARFSDLAEQVRAVFSTGGKQGVAELPLLRSGASVLRVGFNMRNRAAEQWLIENSSRLVTAIVEDQRNAIRAIAAEGMQLGRGPRSTALDIVGRVGETGRRTGGVIGLTSQQAQFVSNARAELSSGDPRQMAHYFTRQRRDKRFDAAVRKAIAAGKPLKEADIDRIAGRYADRLLQLRGEMIARTETMQAFAAGREQAMLQAIESGAVDAKNVTSIWETAHDKRVRESHHAMQGQTVPFGQPFVTPRGAQMRYPGDSSLGAGADEIVACRCIQRHKIDFLSQELG